MSYCSNLFVVALISTVFSTCLAAEVFLERGIKGVIFCDARIPFGDWCAWKYEGKQFVRSTQTLKGYTISRNKNTTCDLIIAVARTNDTGKWSCEVPGNTLIDFDVTTTARPKALFFVYNNRTVSGKVKVTPNATTGEVFVSCLAKGAYPAVTISWKVNDVDKLQEDIQTTLNDDRTYVVNSTIKLDFALLTAPGARLSGPRIDRDQYEKRVSCSATVEHLPGKIYKNATFAQEYPTTQVVIAQEKCKPDNKVMEMVCEADGFPEPDSYEFLQVDPETKKPIGKPTPRKDPNLEVQTEGTYMCKATNTRSTSPVTSNPITLKPCGQDNNSAFSSRPASTSLMMVLTTGVVMFLRKCW